MQEEVTVEKDKGDRMVAWLDNVLLIQNDSDEVYGEWASQDID